jgi:hypothetical protein
MSAEARSYSWPPFEPGNTLGRKFEPGHELSLKHGARSPRRVDPLAAAIVEAALDLARAEASTTAFLLDASYGPALRAWAVCEARCELVRAWLADHGGLDGVAGDGEIRPAADLLTRLENQALKHRERLGLDPLSRARLGRDVAAGRLDVALAMARLGDDEDGADVAVLDADDANGPDHHEETP